MKQKLFFAIIFGLFMAVNSFSQTTYYVSASGDNSDGLTEATAYNTVNTAVTAATAGDTIIIFGSVTETTRTTINKNLTFTGMSSASLTTSASLANLLRINTSVTVTFTDVTFTGVSATAAGAVLIMVNNANANATFTNCTFSSNSTNVTNGGGVMFIGTGNTVTLTDCVLNGNSSTAGASGAIALVSTGVLNASGTTFYNNSSTGHGSVTRMLNTATASFTNCTFFNNSSNDTDAFEGCAIRVATNAATLTITNCLFYNNLDGDGDYADIAGSANASGSRTVDYILAQFTNANITATNSNVTGSDFLSTSNIAWNATNNQVEFTAPDDVSDATPIDFGNDTSDIGAWDSKINIFKGGATGALESWAELTNWSNGALPTATDNVAILTGGACTLNTNATINDIKVTGRLDIKNDQSLIVSGDATGSGTINYLRNLTDNADLSLAWHLVSSPLNDEIFDGTFVTENDITANGDNRGIASYTSSSNSWSYFNTVSNTSITATRGKGFSMKITPDGVTAGERADNVVEFSGSFNTADVLTGVVTDGDGFNLIGNPYTSNINSATFLTDNTGSLVSQTIWVWDSAAGNYDTYVTGDSFVLAPAQGFFVRASASTDLTFAESNQSETGGTFQKASRTEIKLLMNDGTANRFAKIYYLPNATTGFDNGYDGETFGGIPNSIDVYTNLLSDNVGKKYQLQSLPDSGFEDMVIPVGVTSASDKELTFTAEAANLPDGLKIYLEDRENNIFTELTASNSYKVTLTNALNSTGRFFLHTKSSALSTNDIDLDGVSVYQFNENTLRISGVNSTGASLKMYNVLGKMVVNQNFSSKGVQDVNVSNLNTGVYIVQLSTNKGKLNKKIVLE